MMPACPCSPPPVQVVAMLRRSGLLERIGEDNLFVTMHAAVMKHAAEAGLAEIDYTI